MLGGKSKGSTSFEDRCDEKSRLIDQQISTTGANIGER